MPFPASPVFLAIATSRPRVRDMIIRSGRIGSLLVLLLAAMPSALSAQDWTTFARRMSQTVPDRMAHDSVAGVVIVLVEHGTPVWTGAFGMADPASGRVMDSGALFRVESLSKPVTAWGAMRLAETGWLDLDAPIDTCPGPSQLPEGAHQITPRALLSHTAGVGLGDYAERYPPDAPRPNLSEHLTQDFTLIGKPGAGFAYSDTGYNLLELVIERCTGEDFAAFMAREVLVPLGMTGASFNWTGAPMPVGHDLAGSPVAPYIYPGRASGGLHASASDIARFAAAGMAGAGQTVLSSRSVTSLHRPQVAVGGPFGLVAEGYGLGHFTETLSDGRAAVWHGGQGFGWMSHMHLVPETGDGIVILSNSQSAWPLFAVVLREWSKSLGVSPVGMARVLWAETTAHAGIALCLIVTALAFWIVLRGGFKPHSARTIAGVIGTALILWPLWAATQDYLFLFSFLPRLWPWLGAASGLAGLGLVALAIVPGRQR